MLLSSVARYCIVLVDCCQRADFKQMSPHDRSRLVQWTTWNGIANRYFFADVFYGWLLTIVDHTVLLWEQCPVSQLDKRYTSTFYVHMKGPIGRTTIQIISSNYVIRRPNLYLEESASFISTSKKNGLHVIFTATNR